MAPPLAARRLLLVIAYLGFISLGLPDTLIGVAWPTVRDHFHVPQGAVALIFFGGGASYFLSSFFTGRLLQILGVGLLLAVSSLLVALGGFGYALAPVWALFAACSLLHGLGSGAIDAGLNHYVASHFSARHMNWLHACYSGGATLGPLVMTWALTTHSSWRLGYGTVAAAIGALAILFAFTYRLWGTTAAAEAQPVPPAPMAVALRHPVVLGQVALFFIYTGLEATVGQWSFTLLTESRHFPRETAGLWVTLYYGSIGVGRVGFGFVVERLGLDRLLRLSTVAAVGGAALLLANLGPLFTVTALVLTGLGLAPIFPCMMTRTPQRLGPALSAHAIGFQVGAAMLGAAGLPSLAGFLAQRRGLETVAVLSLVLAAALWLLHESLVRATPLAASAAASPPATPSHPAA